MKLAFTTLGCPEWDLSTIVGRAKEYGYDGIDFRGYRGELEIFRLPEFTVSLSKTRRLIIDACLDVACMESSVHAFSESKADLDKAIDEVRAYAKLCCHFNTPFIRVFGGAIGDTPRERAVERMAKNLNKMGEAVEGYGCTVLIETHDDWTMSAHLKAVMDLVRSPHIAVLWDTHHPFRMHGETPRETWAAIGKWVRYTHIKDSVPAPSPGQDYRLCLVGRGDVPIGGIVSVLRGGGYDGYLTLEWEKKWHPELDRPEEAFPGYVKFMRTFLDCQE